MMVDNFFLVIIMEYYIVRVTNKQVNSCIEINNMGFIFQTPKKNIDLKVGGSKPHFKIKEVPQQESGKFALENLTKRHWLKNHVLKRIFYLQITL